MRLIRNLVRRALSASFAGPRRSAWAARLLRPVLRAGFGRVGHAALWHLLELTVNVHRPRLVGQTWFGDRVDCDLFDMIEQRIYYYGVWEPEISRLFRHWLKAGDVFVDVGANVGYFSLLGARLVGETGYGVAIEAWPPTAQKLDLNLQLNSVATVRVCQVAITDSRGSVAMYAGTPDNAGMASVELMQGSGISHQVRSALLLDVIDDIDLSRITLIKIDIEGGEVPVLRQILRHIDRFGRRLCIVAEMTPDIFKRAGWPISTVVQEFAAAGFTAKIIVNDYVVDPDWVRFDPDPLPDFMPASILPDTRFDLAFIRDNPPSLNASIS